MFKRKLRRDILSKQADLIQRSECAIKFNATREQLTSVLIELTGPAATFPSTSNDKKVHYVRGRVRIGHSTLAVARMNAAKALYFAALENSRYPKGGFGELKTHVLVGLSRHPQGCRFDSHNMCKPIGDWLQAIGLIDDDTNTEIYCYKKTEYPEEEYKTTTTITIQLRDKVQILNEAYFNALKDSAGFL